MIVQCEKCRTKFGLEESLLKEEGSKVRCSVCKHVFIVHPPAPAPEERLETTSKEQFDFEALGGEDFSGGAQEEIGGEPREQEATDFDKLFEEEPADVSKVEVAAPEDLDTLVMEEKGKEEVVERETEKTMEVIQTRKESATGPAPVKKPRKSRFGIILLIILLLLAGGAGAIYYLAPQLIPDSLPFLKPAQKKGPTDTGARRLAFKDVSGSFVTSNKAGNLFVVRGTVANNYPENRSFILIKGTILDEKGEVVKAKMAYAGNTFTNEEIKEMPLREINKAAKNRFGMARKNFNMPPEETIPFMIVFENLPDNLSEFTVEAVSSSPGT